MRVSVAALALVSALATVPARAADYHVPLPLPDDALRGSQTAFAPPNYANWSGFYFGGQAGMTYGNVNFGNASSQQISYILSNSELQDVVSGWTTLPQVKGSSRAYGGFIGYNIQWGEVTTGIELNYNRMNVAASAADSIGPLIVNGANQPDGSTVRYSVIVNSAAALTIHDIATFRARFGWVTDRLHPYGFVGLAVGRAESMVSTNITLTKSVTPPPDSFGVITPGPFLGVSLPRNPQNDSKSQVAFGFAAGLGLEVGVTENLFLRAEWEFVEFPSINDFRVQINSVRAAVGFKF